MTKIHNGKIIYTKRIKDLLERKYNIYPLIVVPNPRDHTLDAWVYINNNALRQAIANLNNDKEV